jgi:hypothetical protein
MTSDFCNCIHKEIVVAYTIGKYLYTQLRCKECGRMFTENEKLDEIDFPKNSN